MDRSRLPLTALLIALPASALAQTAPTVPTTQGVEASPADPQPSVSAAASAKLPPAVPISPNERTGHDGRNGRQSVEVAYFGQNFIRPGMQLGYSVRALQTPGRLHALVVGADVGAYAWLHHDFGVFVLPRLGWRGRHRVGLQGELNFHLGYLQSVLASPAYQVVGGQVVEASREGIANLLLGATAGVGWFLPTLGLTPFARVGALWHTPVFDQTMLRFVLNVGAEVRL
ncbi:MAG TPA: hypothetical protein PKI03_18520 [Pseudomonadota bacterium]|nr:hypothetical protein [Pseudomonadota bacterium]